MEMLRGKSWAGAATLAAGLLVGIPGTAQAEDLNSCPASEYFSGSSTAFTAACPSGLINGTSNKFYSKKPRVKGTAFGKAFAVRIKRSGDTVSMRGTYGGKPVQVSRVVSRPGSRLILDARGSFGTSRLTCSTTAKLRMPGLDGYRWSELVVNGTVNPSARTRAWKRCALSLITLEATAYTGV